MMTEAKKHRPKIAKRFDTSKWALPAEARLAVIDPQTDRLLGFARTTPPYQAVKVLRASGLRRLFLDVVPDDDIREYLGFERVLCELAVDQEFARRGVGTALLAEAELRARESGGRVVTGFLDARNSMSATFYRANGYWVGQRNQPQPPLTPLEHSRPDRIRRSAFGHDGFWFYKRLR